MQVLTSVPPALPLNSWQHYVLVIEANAEARDVYRSALRTAGFAAIGAEDCVGALRIAETQVPSAIVVVVPQGLDGREMQRILRSDPHTRRVPIVGIAGSDLTDLDLDDVACVLRKPVDAHTLVVAVRHTVRQSSRRLTDLNP